MSAAINVRLDAIAEFDAALGRFVPGMLERLRRAATVLRLTTDELEARHDTLRRKVRRLEDELADTDEEDTGRLRRRLEETEASLAGIRRARRNLEAGAQDYQRAARRLETLLTEGSVGDRALLRGLLDDLAAYLSIQVREHGPAGDARQAAVSATARGVATPFDPTAFALPPGYRWVCIGDIDATRELAGVQDEAAYEKVSYAEMRRGYDVLCREVLPAMNDPERRAGSDTFAGWDAAAGRNYEAGLQRIYDAFFGGDPIYLSRGRGGDPFSVTSGRHRIKAAMDAGWTAFPARVSDPRA